MKEITKEELIPLIQKMTELLGEHFPGVTFFACVCSSDGLHNASSRSGFLQDPDQLIRLLASHIRKTMEDTIIQRQEILRLFHNQQTNALIEEAKHATKQ